MNLEFLESYDGQTIREIVAMKSTHRVDSLVTAVEQALDIKPRSELTTPEQVVLAIEALEREVNNGGYEQFFINSSREFTDVIVNALELIGCPKTAAITAEAIAVLQLPEHFEADLVEKRASEFSDDALDTLAECDSQYYETKESIGGYAIRLH